METAGSRAEGERVGRHARQHAHVTLQPVVPSKIVAAPCQHKHQRLGHQLHVRVRVEIMGLGKYENVGKSQPVLIMINPIIITRTRINER
jgi:hypothetical protein